MYGVGSIEELERYFQQHVTTVESLLEKAAEIVTIYMTARGADRALNSSQYSGAGCPIGQPWCSASQTSEHIPPAGDEVLHNTILRMRDSMVHYEFQSAIADGDIGRAMNVMAVCSAVHTPRIRSYITDDL